MSKPSPSTHMPAEWEPHTATWLAWPHNVSHWPDKFECIPPTYAAIIRALAPTERVNICVNDAAMEDLARSFLIKEGITDSLWSNIHFYRIPTDASWSRDHGPIFVKDSAGNVVATDWIFNAWGAKYEPYDQDNQVPKSVAKQLSLPILSLDIVLEGGSIDVNGKGTLLTTEQCLLNPNRNPHLSRLEIEKYLFDYLGIVHVLWLKEGIVGDDTDGHIDDIARFVNPTTILTAVETNPDDENYAILQENLSLLQTMKDQDGNPLKIVKLPMPEPVFFQGQRLPASYANFYIANGVVIVPLFNCDQDKLAIDILQSLFPDRSIKGIDCVDLVWGLGTLHCSTQQQPK